MKQSNIQLQRSGFPRKETFIYPGEKDQVNFWTKKWGVTADQLNEAILQTGSIRVNEIRNYFVNKGVLFSFSNFVIYLKNLITKKQQA